MEGEGGSGSGGISLLLSEAKAMLTARDGEGQEGKEEQQHLFLPHPEQGYERVVLLAFDPARGLQVQGVGGEARWIAWPELKAVAEKRCVAAE
jgi:hypothetical protein